MEISHPRCRGLYDPGNVSILESPFGVLQQAGQGSDRGIIR